MKLVHTVSLLAAAFFKDTAALPSSSGGTLLDSRGVPVDSSQVLNSLEGRNLSALYEIPDDLKNWPWWCSSDRSYCGASWAPTVSESTALADYLRDLGDTQCTLERAKGSKDDAYTIMAVINGHAKVGGFFTHLGDTDRAYKVSYPCLQLGYILYSLIEACQCNGRVVGSTPLPNCWLTEGSLLFTGDQNSPPGGVSTYPGAGVGISPYP